MLQQLVWSVLLLALVNSVTTHECLNGQLDDDDNTENDFIQYCYNGEWSLICYQDNVWDNERAAYACTQLGYENTTAEAMSFYMNECQSPSSKVVTLTNCTGPGLTQCTVTPSQECNDSYSFIKPSCLPANCTPGSLRLVGGTTDREGRVEVCVHMEEDDFTDSRWRTVCTNNNQHLAGAVCEKLGYPFEGGSAVVQNSFPHGTFPKYGLSFELTNDGNWTCEGIEQNCTNQTEYGVVCRNYEELCNERNTASPITSCTNSEATAPCSGSNVGIGVLLALLVAVTVSWIVTSVVLLRKIHTTLGQKQHDSTAITKLSTNQSYTQQEIKLKSNPDTDQTNMATDAYNRLSSDQAQDYMIDDTTYDYADHNLVTVKSTSAPAHPPPVGGVSDDEFYNVEGHTYAIVNKNDKAKKKSESASDKENSL